MPDLVHQLPVASPHSSPGCEIAGPWQCVSTLDLKTGELTWTPCPGCDSTVTTVEASDCIERTTPGRRERVGHRVTFRPCGCTARIPNRSKEAAS